MRPSSHAQALRNPSDGCGRFRPQTNDQLQFLLGRVFKMIGDAVFEEKAGWQGATKENTLYGSLTEEQRRQTAFSSTILRTTCLYAGNFVVATVIARCGDTPAAPPRFQPKSLAAAPQAF